MISKQELQEATAVILGVSGFISTVFGAATFTTGCSGIAAIKIGEFLKPAQSKLEKIIPLGTAAIGTGMMMSGLGLAIAHSRNRQVKSRSSFDPKSYRQFPGWDVPEPVKQVCRGCSLYEGGGRCTLHGYSKADCRDYIKKASCIECKYYCANQYLRCAVHPSLPANCPDWEPRTDVEQED